MLGDEKGVAPSCDHPRLQNPPDAASRRVARKLLLAGCLATIFMLGEAAGGYLAGSLAVMTDAAHMLSDVCSFAIALTAHHMSRRSPTNKHSFGFHRAEILGALLSIMLIWAVTGVLLYEAVQRVVNPEKVDGRLMFIVACCGLGLNLLLGLVLGHPGHSHSHGGSGDHSHGHGHGGKGGVDTTSLLSDEGIASAGAVVVPAATTSPTSTSPSSVSLSIGATGPRTGPAPRSPNCRSSPRIAVDPSVAVLMPAVVAAGVEVPVVPAEASSSSPTHAHNDDNINMRAAMLHVIGDVVQSIGVVIAGALIWAKPEWHLADPITTFFFSIIVLFTTWRMLKEAVAILMESTPRDVDYDDVVRVLSEIPDVTGVHDLHIWSITAGKTALSVHLETSKPETALSLAQDAVWREFGIYHSTIQIEHDVRDDCCHPCGGV